jgi:hypothetical protein
MKSGGALAIFQLKPAKDSGGTLFQYSINANGTLSINDNINGKWTNNRVMTVASLADFVNQTHTIRTTIKEGKAGLGNFIKVEIDGVQKYLRDTGVVGTSINGDGIKFGGIYDFDNAVVHADSLSRGRQATIVTEAFRAYIIPNLPLPNIPPTASAGADKTITLPTNIVSLSGSGADADGTISTYKWTKISGPSSYNIAKSSFAVTDVTGLTEGVYKFELKVTDNNGATATSTVQVTVNAAVNIPPTANAGANKTNKVPNYIVTNT